MSKYSEIFDFMKQCPKLADLWSIAATENIGVNVILPQGASPAVQYQEKTDALGNYCCDIVPYPSVYEDYQINCYKVFDPLDSSEPSQNINVLSIDDVQSVCDWVADQNNIGNLPNITGKKIISIECNPAVPQIRAINREENIIAYFVTVRIRYVNTAKGRCIEYESED